MSELSAEHLVGLQIRDIKHKLEGVGGKNLSPRERVTAADNTLEIIYSIRDQKPDVFFSTKRFKRIVRWLKSIREPSVVSSR